MHIVHHFNLAGRLPYLRALSAGFAGDVNGRPNSPGRVVREAVAEYPELGINNADAQQFIAMLSASHGIPPASAMQAWIAAKQHEVERPHTSAAGRSAGKVSCKVTRVC